MAKTYLLNAEQIKPLVAHLGSCYASDKITVDGMKVGYMYCEEPNYEIDSGWRFFSGTESQEYADNPANFEIYDLNTICNYDPSIVPFLESPPGVAFVRDPSTDRFVREDQTAPDDEAKTSWWKRLFGA